MNYFHNDDGDDENGDERNTDTGDYDLGPDIGPLAGEHSEDSQAL